MILPIHIIIAVTSLIAAFITYFYPSVKKLRISYFLVALTFVSGFALVWIQKPTHMAQVCITGLIYLGIVSVAVVAAQKKLVKA